jgi:hypothetical protein
MITLDDLRDGSAINLLENYKGKNPYISKLKKGLIKNKKIKLTTNQVNYINENHDKDPIEINKIVRISPYLGEELQKSEGLSFVPEKILIEFILADMDKSIHIYGRVKKNQKKGKLYWIPKTQLFDDPYFEEIHIDVDFEKYTKLDTLGRTPFEHQKEGIKFLLGRKGCILADDMGLGKAESVDNKVFTPLGRKRIGDIKIGDFVIGSNGKPTMVNNVFPQGIKDLYRVTFNDGYSVLCCKEHLWTVTSNNGSENNKNRGVKYVTLSVEQMLDENLELQQNGVGRNGKKSYKFKTFYKQSNGQNKWQIPIVKPIEFSRFHDEELPIDPYLLGVILGDGCILDKSVQVSLHKDDFDEIFDGHLINENKSSGNIRRCNINLGEFIKNLKLDNTRSHTKFIPNMYKYSSIKDRLAILQGLMDTDGYCMKSKNGNFTGTEYCTVSEQLADDVTEIVHSLGGIVRKKSKIGSYKKPDGTKVECKKVYRLNIKLPEDFNPFRLKRKSDEYNTPKKYKVGRYIKNIELEKSGEAVCIRVDADDSLYVTEHGIVTHNTYEAIIAALESGAEKILVVCPSSLKINWEREINCFCEETAIVNGRKWGKSKFTIINYDILKNFHTLDKGEKGDPEDLVIEFNRQMVNSKFDMVIIDEAHYLKNHKSIRGEIMTDLCVKHGIETVWLLTGTPIANRPMDYFNLLNLIKAPIANNWHFFATRYCDGRKFFKTLKNGRKKQIWITDGASNLDELANKTRNIILRRKKEDVLDMPEKTITPLYHELSDIGWSDYNNLWDEYLEKRKKEGKRGNVERDLVELILLRKHIAMEAIPHTIEIAESAIEQNQKVIIFTNFTDELMALKEKFGNQAVIHYGPMNNRDKQAAVDRFQNDDKVKVFIGNIKSAGVGITLTASNVVIFNSFDWVPGNNEQCEDRAYRIGQKNNVSVYYQLFDETISTRIWQTLQYKKDIIATIMGEKFEYDDAEVMHQMINIIEEND